MLVFGGLPLFYMELCLGQFHRWFLKQNNDQFSFKGILRTWERKLENLRTSELRNLRTILFSSRCGCLSLWKKICPVLKGVCHYFSSRLKSSVPLFLQNTNLSSRFKGWLRHLCDWHLHGDVLQHHHRLGRLLLRRKVMACTTSGCDVGEFSKISFSWTICNSWSKWLKDDKFSIIATGEYAANSTVSLLEN